MTTNLTLSCSGCSITKIIKVDKAQLERWRSGELIQNVFPDLSSEERELMISQICNTCWDRIFPKEES